MDLWRCTMKKFSNKFLAVTTAAAAILIGSTASAHTFQCTGTEPGWSATLDQHRRTIRVLDQSDPNRPATVRARFTAAAGRNIEQHFSAVSAYLTMSVVHTGNCSDGMSDTVYPLAVMLHGYKPWIYRGAPLEGCCRRTAE